MTWSDQYDLDFLKTQLWLGCKRLDHVTFIINEVRKEKCFLDILFPLPCIHALTFLLVNKVKEPQVLSVSSCPPVK